MGVVATLRDMMLRRALTAAVLSLVVVAGCAAAEKLSPRVAVREAAERTANQKEGSFTLSLAGSEADLNALFNEGAPLTEEDKKGLDILRASHITFSTGQDKFALEVKAGDLDHALELRYVDKKLYARADLAGLAKLFGGSPDEVNQTLRGLAAQEGFGFLAAAAEGRWISADLSTMSGLFESLEQQFLGGTGGSIPVPTTDPAAVQSQFEALKDAFGQAMSEDVTIKELESDSVGDHYAATVGSLRTFYAKVRPVLEQQMGQLPYADGLPPASAVPDKPATLDVWVKSGRVSRLELDLNQFAPAPPANAGRVALRLDIAPEAAAVTAPSDAVAIDIAGLVQKFVSQFGSFLEGVSGGLNEYD